jgi:hypothetical protein
MHFSLSAAALIVSAGVAFAAPSLDVRTNYCPSIVEFHAYGAADGFNDITGILV